MILFLILLIAFIILALMVSDPQTVVNNLIMAVVTALIVRGVIKLAND